MMPSPDKILSMRKFLDEHLADSSISAFPSLRAYPEKMLEMVELAETDPTKLSTEQKEKLSLLQKIIQLAKSKVTQFFLKKGGANRRC